MQLSVSGARRIESVSAHLLAGAHNLIDISFAYVVKIVSNFKLFTAEGKVLL